MRNKISNIFLGLIFVGLGLAFLGNAFELWDFTIFFDGWWTLFIIIPCAYSMISQGVNVGNLIGLGIGAILLLSAQDIIEYDTARKVFFPLVIILVGLGIIFKAFKGDKEFQKINNAKDGSLPNANAVFGGSEPNFTNMEFNGANSSAVFGGVELNLRNAHISEDCVINCNAIFGGIDIFLPPNVKVKIDALPVLGGVSNKYISSDEPNAPVVYIKATCVCGGVEIK